MKLCKKKDKVLLFISVLMGAVNAVAIAFVSLVLQRIVDVAMRGDEKSFWRLFIIIMIYMAGLCLMGFAEAMCGKVLLRNVTKHLRKRIFDGVMTKSPDAYFESNSADYLSAIVNDVKMVEENYLIPLLMCTQMIALFFATLGILCYLSPIVTAILVAFLFLMFLVPILFGKALQKRQDEYSEQIAVFTAKTKDFLSGYEVIRGFSIGKNIQKKYQMANRETSQAKFRVDKLAAVNESLADMLSTLSTVIIVFVAAYMVLKGHATAGMLLALIQLSATFTTPVLVIMQNIPKITGMKPVLKKLETLCEAKTEERDMTDTTPITFTDRLELKAVSFAYEEGKDILKGINMTIKSGRKYVLHGESGCGKTTLLKLLTGYSRNYGGSIKYDGKEVREMHPEEISRMVSVIHQNVYLFDTDIWQNICLDETFEQKEWDKALKVSGVSRFLGQMEDGMHTRTGENGNRLSGGQCQRIAVARALIRNTPILILDEGTSAVDKETARAIEKDLLEEKDLTLIVVTHHMLDELKLYYDGIISMENGQL